MDQRETGKGLSRLCSAREEGLDSWGGSCIPSLGPGRGGSWDESTTKKKLLKKLAVSADVPRPAGQGWGQRRTPDRTPATKERVTGSGGSAGAAQHPGKRSRGEQHRRPGSPGELGTGGTSKPGHFNIGAARETEGRLEDAGTLDGNRRSWLRRDLKAPSRWPPGPRARWPPRTQRRRGQRKQQEEKKKKEEKWCLLSRWCCEEGKEGHGQPGAVARRGLRKGGGGFLPPGPASAASQRRESAAGAWHAGQEQHHPLRAGGHGARP
ncbi:collagen alpha-1(II) chain-like [Catharus ustulatus]|uniref:collagen alpha-1(II) chain-like n=1 Tax=Catharus ustulatus TaxID=91951 RepID=UPI00140B4568|nr:collagen alpha-1(II) chain-like [Catharus ustulatus]